MTTRADSAWVGATDADLATSAAAGDRGAFAAIYDRYADRLYDFCVGLLRDRDTAADCVQDTFCTAATKLSQLREAEKLRPWLYSIARNEALRHVRERRREEPTEMLPELETTEAGPHAVAARAELADLVAEAAGGLSERDRTILDLTYRHELDGNELAEVLGVSQTNAGTLVHRLRDTVERSLGALLVARHVKASPEHCPELATILDGWDGHFSVLMRKRVSRHVESCQVCEEERNRRLTPATLLGGAPVFLPAPDWLREHTLTAAQLPMAADLSDTPRPTPQPAGRRHRTRVAAAAACTGLIVAGALTLALLPRDGPGDVAPAVVTTREPTPVTTTPQVSPVPAQLLPPAPTSSAGDAPVTPATTAPMTAPPTITVTPEPTSPPAVQTTATTDPTQSFAPTTRPSPTRTTVPPPTTETPTRTPTPEVSPEPTPDTTATTRRPVPTFEPREPATIVETSQVPTIG